MCEARRQRAQRGGGSPHRGGAEEGWPVRQRHDHDPAPPLPLPHCHACRSLVVAARRLPHPHTIHRAPLLSAPPLPRLPALPSGAPAPPPPHAPPRPRAAQGCLSKCQASPGAPSAAHAVHARASQAYDSMRCRHASASRHAVSRPPACPPLYAGAVTHLLRMLPHAVSLWREGHLRTTRAPLLLRHASASYPAFLLPSALRRSLPVALSSNTQGRGFPTPNPTSAVFLPRKLASPGPRARVGCRDRSCNGSRLLPQNDRRRWFEV